MASPPARKTLSPLSPCPYPSPKPHGLFLLRLDPCAPASRSRFPEGDASAFPELPCRCLNHAAPRPLYGRASLQSASPSLKRNCASPPRPISRDLCLLPSYACHPIAALDLRVFSARCLSAGLSRRGGTLAGLRTLEANHQTLEREWIRIGKRKESYGNGNRSVR